MQSAWYSSDKARHRSCYLPGNVKLNPTKHVGHVLAWYSTERWPMDVVVHETVRMYALSYCKAPQELSCGSR